MCVNKAKNETVNKKVAEKFVFLEYFPYICTIDKIRIKYIRDIMINFSKFNSLYSVATYFNTEVKCQQAIVESRWGDDVVCPYCGKHLKGGDFTNTIEGFWATLKRMIEGIYHSITSKYLQRYVDEAVYRYNCRKMKGCECFRDMFAASIGVVDYNMVQMLEIAA